MVYCEVQVREFKIKIRIRSYSSVWERVHQWVFSTKDLKDLGEVKAYHMHCGLEVGYFTNRGKESNSKKNITFRKEN